MEVKKYGSGSDTNLKKRFFLWSAIILFGGGILLSVFSYWNIRRLLMADAMTQSEVILLEVEAIRSYVKEELRPKMYELHGKDTLIIEAMSTTYISTSIMARFAETMPEYIYRRASQNPHNQRNLADPFEEEMIDWFEADPSRLFWQDVVKKNGASFFVSMVPDYFTPSCIRCHGEAKDAPRELIERYGVDGGFRFKAGDLAGIDSVAIPVSESLHEAWQGSIYFFIISLGGSGILLWLLNILFQRLVIERLSRMLELITEKNKESGIRGQGDELDILHASFGTLNRYVRSARKGSSLQANFISGYVITQPIAAGAMSWLYNGYSSSKTEDSVSLKIGFDEALQNPFYRACFETELLLFQELNQPSLPKVLERLTDVLIFEEITGRNLATLLENGPLKSSLLLSLFSQLCDLVAFLHAKGIVHHDLRPQTCMFDKHKQLTLIDMGLAASDQQPDPIAAAGLGPQGDLEYMAPELILGKRGDPRSDIYGLGFLLYMASTGHYPFPREKRPSQNYFQKRRELIPPGNSQNNFPVLLEQVIVKSLAYDATERYQWVEDFQEDLQNAMK